MNNVEVVSTINETLIELVEAGKRRVVEIVFLLILISCFFSIFFSVFLNILVCYI